MPRRLVAHKVQPNGRRQVRTIGVTAHRVADRFPDRRQIVSFCDDRGSERPGEVPAFGGVFDEKVEFGQAVPDSLMIRPLAESRRRDSKPRPLNPIQRCVINSGPMRPRVPPIRSRTPAAAVPIPARRSSRLSSRRRHRTRGGARFPSRECRATRPALEVGAHPINVGDDVLQPFARHLRRHTPPEPLRSDAREHGGDRAARHRRPGPRSVRGQRLFLRTRRNRRPHRG